MFQRLSTAMMNKILIAGAILLVIELCFFHGGLIFAGFIWGFFLFIGWKKYHRLWGKILFWIGSISLLLTLLNMIAVRFILLTGIVLFLIHYFRSERDPKRIRPQFSFEDESLSKEPMMKMEPLFGNQLFGDQKTTDDVYSWQDINIHGGYGNRIIDLSHTVLPDQAIISIRHVIGKIEIYIPYEVEVSILHSSLIGRAVVLGNKQMKLFNQSLSYQTENYHHNKPRVKIITSIISGDIEVKRI